MSGNARQQRRAKRQIKTDHFRWPLGTPVLVRAGHHSPAAVGMQGRVAKHGYPCTDGTNCIVDFPRPVEDKTFGAARYAHYIDYRHLQRLTLKGGSK